jgi:hypothetical protein
MGTLGISSELKFSLFDSSFTIRLMSHRLQRFNLELYLHNVTASLGWFDKFQKRNELKNVTMLGEAASAPTFLSSSN